ncbi:hypothetical protein ACFE04_031530 [Oxalis oulophora]
MKVSGDVDHDLLIEKFAKIKKSAEFGKKAKRVSFPNHKGLIANNPVGDSQRVKQKNDRKDTNANNPAGGCQHVKQGINDHDHDHDHLDFSNDKDAILQNMENDDLSWYSPTILKRKGFMKLFEFLGFIKKKEVKVMIPNPLKMKTLKQTNTQPLQVPPLPIFPQMNPFGRMMPQAHYGSYNGGYPMFDQPPMRPPMMKGGLIGPPMNMRGGAQDGRDNNQPRSPPPRGNPMIHYGPQDNYHLQATPPQVAPHSILPQLPMRLPPNGPLGGHHFGRMMSSQALCGSYDGGYPMIGQLSMMPSQAHYGPFDGDYPMLGQPLMMPSQAHYGSYGGGYPMLRQPPMTPIPMMGGGMLMLIGPHGGRLYY